VRRCFSLPSPPQQQFPSHGARPLVFGGLFKPYGLCGKSLFKGQFLLNTTASHGAAPNTIFSI
jgi:hypothetical protein